MTDKSINELKKRENKNNRIDIMLRNKTPISMNIKIKPILIVDRNKVRKKPRPTNYVMT